MVKSVTSFRQKAINSRALVVKKTVFDKNEISTTCKVTSTPKATTTPKDVSKPKASTPKATTKKNTTEKADEQDFHCPVCQRNEISDMRLCVVCNKYIHEDCVDVKQLSQKEQVLINQFADEIGGDSNAEDDQPKV
ncbi:unnamed protein product [Brassicogethes aeneus]|uniref:Zinc finger PHD-type domain-containing protein n=1 Tax=Brassicogethes aeneus TaxID=1431903 RepID=A0A9P0BAL1_BRAAE|nr:unnamed protein product [Brassicogethes aeneus]